MVEVTCPGTKVFTITPNTANGYYIFEVDVNFSYVAGPIYSTFSYPVSVSAGTPDPEIDAYFAQSEYTVTTSINPPAAQTAGCTVTGSMSGKHYGDLINLQATEGTGWTFSGWSGYLPGTAPLLSFNMPAQDVTQTANFSLKTYTLTYNAGDHGALGGTTSQSVTYGSSGSSVNALAVTGYHFVRWDDGITANPRTDTNVKANINVTAIFEIDTFTLHYTADPQGSIGGAATQTVNYGDSGSAVTAVPLPGYHFILWSDGSTVNPRTDTNVTKNISVTASFNTGNYNLYYTWNGNGSISGTLTQSVAHGGSGTPVTAEAVTGWHFVRWSDGLAAATRQDINVTQNINVTAYFDINTYNLTYTPGFNGTISGTSPQVVDYGTNGDPVTAVPNVGFHFVNWSDGLTGETRHDTNVTANINVIANFAINTYTLTYSAGVWGSISGTSPQTVNYLGSGTPVTAMPDIGYSFVNWSDGVTTRTRTDIGVTGDINVTANFTPIIYTLTYTAGPNGTISGTSPQFVPWGGTGAAVTPTPNGGYHFVSWSDGSTDNPRQDTNVGTNIAVTANFAINIYTLTYTAGANGTISGASPQTVNHGASGTAVSAVPATGYHFVSWSDGSTANPRTDINVKSSITVTATFAINTYTLTFNAGAHGSITGTSPQTVNHGASGTAVTAVPDTGYHFINWSDGSTANPRTDTGVTASITVTASFAINTYTLTYTAGANGTIGGTSPQTVNHGANGSPVTPAPDTGYHFVDWSDSTPANPRTDNPRIDINVTANITVTANFAINVYTLTYNAGAHGTITGISPQAVNHGANGSTVTGMPDTGYHFVSWSGGSATNPRKDTNVTQNITVTATFAIDTVNTSSGSNVTVQPANNITGATPVRLTFPSVSQPGITTLSSTTSGQTPPSGFKLAGSNVYYQITTTAVFSGNVTISITYDPAGINHPNQLKLFHFEKGTWVDVTTSLDSINHIIYGSVASLSPFGVFEPGFIYGDANEDGLVTMQDVTKVERIILELDLLTAGADANGDGLTTMADVTKIERIILQLDPIIWG